MEVARFKYSSAWVSLKLLFKSMRKEDADFPNILRGYSIVFSKYPSKILKKERKLLKKELQREV